MEKLIKRVITVREMALPSDIKLSREDLVEWLAVALGLMRPKERRKLMVYILDLFIRSAYRQQPLTFEEIHMALRKREDVDDKTLYYHLNKLQQLGVITRRGRAYMLGDGFERDAFRVFERVYRETFERAMERVKEGFESLYAKP